MVRLFFLLNLLFPQSLALLPSCLPKTLLRVLPFHFFISLFTLPWIPPQSLFPTPPSYSDSLSSLSTHASMDRPSFSLSYTLATSSPSSLPLSHPIYRPLPIYASPRSTNSSMESILCIPQFFLPTPFPCPIMVVFLPWSLLFLLDLSPVVPGERSPEAGPEIDLEAGPGTTLSILPGDNVLDLLLLIVPCLAILSSFPYFPLGPTPLFIITLMIP